MASGEAAVPSIALTSLVTLWASVLGLNWNERCWLTDAAILGQDLEQTQTLLCILDRGSLSHDGHASSIQWISSIERFTLGCFPSLH